MRKGKDKSISRRSFIKKVGYTAGALGITSNVPGLMNTARAAAKDHILIGRPLPMTGPVAAFAQSSPWLDNKVIDAINKQ